MTSLVIEHRKLSGVWIISRKSKLLSAGWLTILNASGAAPTGPLVALEEELPWTLSAVSAVVVFFLFLSFGAIVQPQQSPPLASRKG